MTRIEKDCFYVQTGVGELAVEELQLQGKKRMDAGAFLGDILWKQERY